MGMIDGRLAPIFPPSSPHAPAPADRFATRQAIEDEIERLIGLLDGLDGDPDFEPDVDDEPQGDEEPWLGWIGRDDGTIVHAGTDDFEAEEAA